MKSILVDSVIIPISPYRVTVFFQLINTVSLSNLIQSKIREKSADKDFVLFERKFYLNEQAGTRLLPG